ncbi:hypothetical protein BKA70DRAFT_1540375 [Coprinopsis sp. MPI-PUGE-AT-0042]|nr:hypothetical protein BKA70DRAFT_1540375 [Coprinopsis sp. MPI-PUGE-AT-0042]
MSQIGGGVSTRSSARKALKTSGERLPTPTAGLQRSIAKAQQALASDSASSRLQQPSPTLQFDEPRLPLPPQPNFSVMMEAPKALDSHHNPDHDDFWGLGSTSPLSQPPSERSLLFPPQAQDGSSAHPSLTSASGQRMHTAAAQASGGEHLLDRTPPSTRFEGQSLATIPESGEAPLVPPLVPPFFQLLAAPIPKGFDTVAAQTPASDEDVGSRCTSALMATRRTLTLAPSRQRAGRIPKDHRTVLDGGFREIDEIFLRMHKATGRTVDNLRNHFLASKGFKRTARSIWNQYQRYFAANRVAERAACGNESAGCNEAFLHFQNRFHNWREILNQVDEIITQKEACGSGYRRRAAFNQANQKLESLARINHQTHGFEMFAVIMGNQPNSDQNLFSIIESLGAQGFMGEKEDDRPCAMFTSDFIGSFRAHVNTLSNKAHVANFRSQQDAEAPPSRPEPELADLLALNPTRKEAEDKQTMAPPAVPTHKARSASVLSTSSTSDGNDTGLRTTIRDHFHTKLKLVGVTISSISFPWKQLDKTLASQGGIILNYPDDVPFPNISPDPTYTGPPCKPEGRNGTGIRKIGIPAMRRLAKCCHDGEDGIRFIGGYSKKLIQDSLVPWIVGPVPRDATSTVRCLFYDGSARKVPRQLLPAEWLSTVKHESPSTPKPSKEPVTLHHGSSPTRSQSSTPTPRSANETPPSLLSHPKPISSQSSSPPPETQAAHLPSPTLHSTSLPALAPACANHPPDSPKPHPPFANLHSHPRARIAGARPAPLEAIEQPSVASQADASQATASQEEPHASSVDQASATVVVVDLPKRALEDSGSNLPSPKRLKSLSPTVSQAVVAGGPIQAASDPGSNPPPSEPSFPQEVESSVPVETPTFTQQALISSSTPSVQQDNSRNNINPHAGLHPAAAPVEHPAIPSETPQLMPDHSAMQAPPSMYQGSYAPPPWPTGYGAYPAYGHLPYYPPPQWGYTDSRSNYYQQEPQRDGAAISTTSTTPSHPPNAHLFHLQDGMPGASNRPSQPPPSFYGRPDGPAYPPHFNPRFGSVPPTAFGEQYGHMPPNFPPAGTGMPPPPGHSSMPPPSR